MFVVAYYLLWCGTVGTVYSHFTYDNIQHYFPFVGYYGSKVCFMLSLEVYGNVELYSLLHSCCCCAVYCLHHESKKGAIVTMAINLSILDQFVKSFHCCEEQ